MPDVNGLGDKIVSSVQGFVARKVDPLEARLAELQALWEARYTGIPTVDEVRRIEDRIDEIQSRPMPERGEPGVDGKDGVAGRDGVDGQHGKDGEPGAAGLDGSPGRDGINGKDGAPGADGRSVSLDEIEAIVERRLELKFAGYVVEHERRLPDLLQRMIDKIEKPRDGVDGKDGRDGQNGRDGVDGKNGEDGFDLRHFDVTQTDERTVVFRLKDLTREKKHTLVFPVPIQRGIWNAEKSYARGDIVTWGGSQFEKLTDEPGGKPEESPAWRLCVKRGRDGKDGQKGEKGDPGKAGRNGRDLTQMGSDGSKW